MIAAEKSERLEALRELVKLASVERRATDAGEHVVAKKASAKMKEVVSVLGFDPLEYEPGRDAASILIASRTRVMLAAMPGTTTDIAKAAGVSSSDVRSYLWAYVMRGEISCTKESNNRTVWAVVE